MFQFEYRTQLEALKLKKKEERELSQQGNKRAKEIAENNYRVSEPCCCIYCKFLVQHNHDTDGRILFCLFILYKKFNKVILTLTFLFNVSR